MRGRNVVLVMLESTGARHLASTAASPDPAPNLTALARQSIVVRARVFGLSGKHQGPVCDVVFAVSRLRYRPGNLC